MKANRIGLISKGNYENAKIEIEVSCRICNGKISKSKKIKRRPKVKEDTVVMRVPKSLVEQVKHLIDEQPSFLKLLK